MTMRAMRELTHFLISNATGDNCCQTPGKQDLRPLNILLLTLFAGTQYALWFGDKNVFDLYRLKQAVSQTTQTIETQSQENRRFSAEVNALKAEGESVETIARSELGLIKPGEEFYQVVDWTEE